MGTFFRNLVKFEWAQIFNIWDSKDDNLMPFDICWHHSALFRRYWTLLDTISTLLDTISTLLDTIGTQFGHY